jgi:hypothetical protein
MKILSLLLFSAIALTMPRLANVHESPSYGLPNSTTDSDCTYRGGSRREDCVPPLR